VSVVANVAINVDSRNAVTKLRQVQSQAQATEKAFGALQSAIGALGVGFALTKVIADVKELDTNLRRLGTVGGDVKALDKGLGTLSRNLDGIASKAELAAASYQALSAGFTDTASNLKVVEAATKAAVGGLVDVTGVVEVTTKTLNAYGMSADQAVKVTDSISKSIEFGQVQWSDYTSQLGRVASVAALAGVSLDEVNAFIAAATKNGATAEVAFTGLGSTLATILKPTKESADAAAALGINWTLAGIRGEGFESLMSKLAKAMKENPVLATEMVGGQEAIRGAFAAAAKGGQDYQMILEGLNGAAGKTDADFQTMKGSLENTLKALDTAFKNFSEALGKAFGPTIVIAIQDITKGVNGFADVMGAIPQPVLNAVGELLKLIAQVLLLQKGIQVIIALRSGFVATMVAMGSATAASGTAAKVSAGSFAVYTNNIRALQTQTAATTPVLQGMLATLRTLAAIGTIAIVVNVAVTGMAAVYQAQAEIDRLRGRRSEGGAADAFGGSATAEQKKAQKDALAAIQKERASSGFRNQQAAAAAGIGRTMARQRADLLTERERSARAILALPTRGQATPTVPTVPTLPTGGGGDDKKKKGKTDAEREAEKAAREAARALEIQKEQLKAADDQNFALLNRLAILQETEAVAKRELELDVRLNEIGREYDELKQNAKSNDELILINASSILEKKAAELEAEREINDLIAERVGLMVQLAQAAIQPTVYNELETQKAALQDILDKYPAIGAAADAAATMATSGIQAMIAGTKSAEQVFVDFLSSIANALIDTAKQMIAQYIAIGIARIFAGMGASSGGFAPSGPLDAVGSVGTGFNFDAGAMIPGRAMGGPVTNQQPYIVGERGPELFVPNGSGTIIPNDRFTDSRNALANSGSMLATTSFAENREALGTVSSLERERLVERVLTSGAGSSEIKYNRVGSGDLPFVTEEDMLQASRLAAQEGARLGQQRTLAALKNNPAARRTVGV
jgi:TP901 family phage tail tape measure protein